MRDERPVQGDGRLCALVDAEGNEIDTAPHTKDGTIVLCRCGESKTKPFCDKSHKTMCFRA